MGKGVPSTLCLYKNGLAAQIIRIPTGGVRVDIDLVKAWCEFDASLMLPSQTPRGVREIQFKF